MSWVLFWVSEWTRPVRSEIESRPSPDPVHLPLVCSPFLRYISGVVLAVLLSRVISNFVRITAHISGSGAAPDGAAAAAAVASGREASVARCGDAASFCNEADAPQGSSRR